MNRSFLLAIVATVGLVFPSFAAPPAAPTDGIMQQQLKQQQIKTTTQKVADQLAIVIDEFDRNGIGGQDVAVLKAIRGVLGNLSEKEMHLVLDFLQQARQASDPNVSTKQATEAYSKQKTIILQLKQLLSEYQRQQVLYELSLRFKEFATRQTAYMWSGVRLAKKTEGKLSYTSFDEPQKTELKVQQTDQETLKEEVVPMLKKLDDVVKEISDGLTAERAKLAIKQAREGGMMPALVAAAEELSPEKLKLLSAVGNEKKARDQFREVARLLILSQGEVEALRQALHEVEKTIEEQRQLLGETQKIEKDNAKAEPRQAELVDATDLIKRDVETFAPVAVDHLKSAMDKMQEARSVLGAERDHKQQRTKAPPKQEEAITHLEQARQDLMDQLAKAEQQAEKPEDRLASMKELQEQVRELIKDQEKLKEQTASADKKELASTAPKQGDLRDKAQDLQEKAGSQSPPASQSISEAANQMQKAQNSLAQSQNNAPAQQAALDALQKAEEQLNQDIAKMEQAQKELAQIEDMLKKLEGIIQDQQTLHVSTAKEAAKPAAQPVPEMAAKQDKLGQETGALQQEATPSVPTAAAHLGSAKGKMSDAKSELDKPEAKSAQPKQDEALKELYSAKRELEKKASELQDMLGMSGEMGDLADAASLIEQAQQEVNQAMGEMQQSSPGLLESLVQQQQQIASSLGQKSQTTDGAPALNSAAKAADAAAQQLAQSDLPRAINSMKAAKAGMKSAIEKGEAQKAPRAAPSETPVPELSEQQEKVQKTAEALLKALENASASSLQKAAGLLEKANQTIGPLTSGEMGMLPGPAQSALESAQSSLTSGSGKASAGQGPPAQADAASAAQALAQAQAALAMAQAGLGSGPSMASKGKTPGKGQGQQGPGQGQGRGNPGPQGTGRQGNWDGSGGADGPRRGSAGSGQFTGLPGRDRAALQQSQGEKYPQEYGPLVEQYLKNLADDTVNK